MTSQLLLYCVHISLSTCYDWPTNQLLLLTMSAVCINQSVVSCCHWGSVFSEKTSAQQAARNAIPAAVRYSVQVPQSYLAFSRLDLSRIAYFNHDFPQFLQIYPSRSGLSASEQLIC